MPKHLTKKSAEIVILQKNLKDLQGQLANAQKRILELIQDKDSATEELIKERQLLVELEAEFGKKQDETTKKIGKQIEDWPDVLDSRPKKKIKYKDIQPGEWD